MEVIGNRKGFTLLELLIALFILSIGLLSLVGISTSVMKGNSSSKNITLAATLAQSKLEEIKNLSYDSIASGSDTPSGMSRAWSVVNDSPASDVKTVTVTVSWSDSTSHSVVLATFIARE